MDKSYKYLRKVIEFFDQLPIIYKVFREKYQQKLLIFLFFLFLAFVFWFFRALNERYEAEIFYPVRYTKLPENKILINELPDKLKLRVEATGKKILMHKISLNIKSLRFNVESFSLRESGSNSFYILTNQVKDFISDDLEGIKILDIWPDTLSFHFTDVVTKKVKVKVVLPDFKNLLAKQYAINGHIFTLPDSIIVTGPGNILDTLSFVYTKPIILNTLSDSVVKSYSLEKIKQLDFNLYKVKVVIPVDKFTESIFSAPVVTLNVPDTLTLKTFPNIVRITYRVTLSKYDDIDATLFKPFVDFNDIGQTFSSKLKVGLVDTPKYVHAIKINPGSVEFLIEK